MPRRPPRFVHQLHIVLLETDPPIWRRLQVASTINLRRLHDVLQVAFGWTQSHLYELEINGVTYGEPSPEWDWPVNPAKATHLCRVAPEPGVTFSYLYDFGDNWQHQLVVERVMPSEPGITYPRCVDGARSGPPEDVGGVYGYADFLVAIADPTDPEHDHLVGWSGGHFDPEACDPAAINGQLAHLGPSPWATYDRLYGYD